MHNISSAFYTAYRLLHFSLLLSALNFSTHAFSTLAVCSRIFSRLIQDYTMWSCVMYSFRSLLLSVAEKRRFIKRETVPEPSDLDAESPDKNSTPQSVVTADAAASVIQKPQNAPSSLLNGHTVVGNQPSKEITLVVDTNLSTQRLFSILHCRVNYSFPTVINCMLLNNLSVRRSIRLKYDMMKFWALIFAD